MNTMEWIATGEMVTLIGAMLTGLAHGWRRLYR